MSRQNYRKLRRLGLITGEKDYIQEAIIRETRLKIKSRKRVFGRLFEIPINQMTYNELEYFENCFDNLIVAIEKTSMTESTISRMFGLDTTDTQYVRDNKYEMLHEIEENKRLKKDDLTQDKSKVFPDEVINKEIEELVEEMFYLYKGLLPPDDICDYFRIFPYAKVWDKHVRHFQERLRMEYSQDTLDYVNSKDCSELKTLEEYTEILNLGKDTLTTEVEGIKLWGV